MNSVGIRPHHRFYNSIVTISYFFAFRQGDGLLRASKPYMGAWLLCLVGSSYPISLKYVHFIIICYITMANYFIILIYIEFENPKALASRLKYRH